MPKMVTANRLGDGEIVYLTQSGGWSPRFAEGYAFEGNEEEDRMLSIAAKAEADLLIVVAYAIDVTCDDGGLAPISQRERIRSEGPTVRTELRRWAATSAHGKG